MNRYLLVFAILAASLHAKEVSDNKLGFKIIFPDAPGWSPLEYRKSNEVQSWSVGNQASAQMLSFMVIDAPMPNARPTFKKNAEEWGQGMMTRFSHKLSSQFTKLAGHDAYELVTSTKNGAVELYFSNWMLQAGDTTYGITIVAKDLSKLTDDTATTFLRSLQITK